MFHEAAILVIHKISGMNIKSCLSCQFSLVIGVGSLIGGADSGKLCITGYLQGESMNLL